VTQVDGKDGNTEKITRTDLDLAAEVYELKGAVTASVKSLGGSVDDLRRELRELRANVATKEDLKHITTACTTCPVINTRLTTLETTVNGTDDNPGLAGRTGDLEEKVQSLQIKAAGISIAAAFLATLGLNVPGWLK
jgi:hypothetical protein